MTERVVPALAHYGMEDTDACVVPMLERVYGKFFADEVTRPQSDTGGVQYTPEEIEYIYTLGPGETQGWVAESYG